jgi:hypothetical protein
LISMPRRNIKAIRIGMTIHIVFIGRTIPIYQCKFKIK